MFERIFNEPVYPMFKTYCIFVVYNKDKQKMSTCYVLTPEQAQKP